MVSQIKVNEIIKQSGSSITIGESGDTISLGAALPVGSGGIDFKQSANKNVPLVHIKA